MSNTIQASKTLPNGNTIKVFYDDAPDSPRDWSPMGTIGLMPNRYVTGDETIDHETVMDILTNDLIVAIPVFHYTHGNTTLRASESGNPFQCPWDSGLAGVVYADLETVKKEFGSDDDAAISKAKALLIAEVNTFSQYLEGRVYYFVIEDADGELVDSCGGIYEDSAAKVLERVEANEF